MRKSADPFFTNNVASWLAGLCCLLFAAALLAPAHAQEDAIDFDIPAGPLADAVEQFGEQSGLRVLYDPSLAEDAAATPVSGNYAPREAMRLMLQGTGLTWTDVNDQTLVIRRPGQDAATAGQNTIGQRRPGIEEIIVTGQKREERIQDVPIAISAFSMEDLEAQKLEGGFDLVKAIPNVSFTKTNFTGYNFQIRGVGTQSISATSDPGVAVAFNNTAIIQNRLFEQEYLDIERVEVLRGPQGTLYGRNATAGVINVISNKPEMGVWDGMLDVEVGNYNTRRLRGHFNIPIGDTFAIRGAYASTDREGYTFNSGTGKRIDGRDLWTGRLSIGWQPSDRLRADFIYERFEENDDRLRTGKQLCHRDDGPEQIGDESLAGPTSGYTDEQAFTLRRAMFSQGCQPGSLYSDGAFGTPNGLSYNFVLGTLAGKGALALVGTTVGYTPGITGPDAAQTLLQFQDPYGGKMQSRDLREIESILDPAYRAQADLFQLNVDFDVTDALMFSSQTVYNEDETYSFQDYNRFNAEPGMFTDTSELVNFHSGSQSMIPTVYEEAAPGGVFCDPQLGCSDRVAGFDISQASAEQFAQEFRLQSAFAGPLNFSVGANYTEFEALVDYYVMFNLTTAMAQVGPFNAPVGSRYAGGSDPHAPYDSQTCAWSDFWRGVFEGAGVPNNGPVPTGDPRSACPHVDPNPVDTSKNFEGDGHNYFRSKNPYKLESWAGFGELYWNIQDDLKLTAGLRYTKDKKAFVNVPSQVLLAPSYVGAGTVSKGYPETDTINQQWGEWTGRLVLDWQPVLDFTDETLIYASFSHGYKGGGVNPPTPGFATTEEIYEIALAQGTPEFILDSVEASDDDDFFPILKLTANEYDDTFKPEFINAYEIGTKNTLFNGAVMLNMTAFYYDYTDYQVSQIRDRTAVNENFDSEMWGLELETVFSPTPNWQFLANVGYLKTKIAEGETSIDIMNRTQGDPDYVLAKPWAQLPSNCVVPTDVAENWDRTQSGSLFTYVHFCGVNGLLGSGVDNILDPDFNNEPYDVSNYPELNGGAGLLADLGGNELPQSPRFTVTLGSQYSFDLTREWRATTRIDYYWQDESYHRIYNTEPYDRLKSWSNTNLSFWVNNPVNGITVEAYVKNVFNQTPITGAFLNSDDTGLTTNVFMFDPRLIGVSVRKEW